MKAYMIKDPEMLPKAKLIRILQDLQYLLYWDEESGQMFLNPDKNVSGAGLRENIDSLMYENDLFPEEMGPKDWSPKRKRK